MIDSIVSASINTFPVAEEPVRLRELDICAGRLDDIIEPDSLDISLAFIEDLMVEVPRALSPELWKLQGRRIWLAHIQGQIRAGAMT